MSSERSRRVISALMLEAIEAEMSCSRVSELRADDVLALPEIWALPELSCLVAAASSMSEVHAALDDLLETNSAVAREIIAADFRQLRKQAENAGVDGAVIDPVGDQIAELLGFGDALSAEDLRLAMDATVAAVA